MQKAAAPQQSKKTEDLSDELTSLFDDGTKLGGTVASSMIPTTPVTTVTRVTPVTVDAAPKRDFTRVANSVIRDAVPAGVFTGKGKQLYDYLYTHTRGAIIPTHSTRIPTEQVMRGAGMTRHTYRAHVQRLVSTGLVSVEERPGEHGGNVFTVYLPEEIGINRSYRGDRGDTSDSGQNLPVVQGSEVDTGDRSLNVAQHETSGISQTLIKTTTKNDDEALALSGLNSILIEAVRKITGRAPKASEREQWAELARTLVEELNGAAARAESVSSVPAFLNAHLRRKLAQKPPARRGEGKHSTSAIAPPASPSEPHRKLSPEDIAAFTATVSDLLGEGKTLEEIETQFAESMHPEDWVAVKDMAQAQMAAKEGN
jgi:hypothetical protein